MVKFMRVAEMQTKDVISLADGKKIGRIVDIEITNEGVIEYFVVEMPRFFRFFRSGNEINITINQIKKIGEDVILVEI